VAGTEDCLVLSVYTPSLLVNSANKLPVLFWIHGGGFVVDSGNKDLYGAERLIDHDIVRIITFY
jgi:para-nitrobenzyl esterase